jgi:hypothetical protein
LISSDNPLYIFGDEMIWVNHTLVEIALNVLALNPGCSSGNEVGEVLDEGAPLYNGLRKNHEHEECLRRTLPS